MVTHQILRQIVQAKDMSTVDSGRFMAVVSVAEFDAGWLGSKRNGTICSGGL